MEDYYSNFNWQDAQRAEQERQLQKRYRSAYKWLGAAWNDISLKARTFESFDTTRQPDAFDVVRLFFAEPKGNLIVCGTFGTGKTHLLAAGINAQIERGFSPRFTTSLNLFAAVQHCVTNHQGYQDLMTEATTTPLLILDDVDKAKRSDFREEIYFAIIDGRDRRGLPTALSTNRVDDLIHFVGGAVASRLQVGMIVAEMVGDDYRRSQM